MTLLSHKFINSPKPLAESIMFLIIKEAFYVVRNALIIRFLQRVVLLNVDE